MTVPLHGVRPPHFSERIAAPGAAVADWATLVRRSAERYAEWNRRVGRLADAEIAAIRARLIAAAGAVSPVVRPVLAHRDLSLANALIHNGRFAALLDFEAAKAYDPLIDFIKLGTHVFARWPGGLDPFLAGYHRQARRVPLADERLATCLAMEQFAAVPNWANHGEARLLGEACQLLRDWLAGATPWWAGRIGAALS